MKALLTENIKRNSEDRLYNLPCPIIGLTGGIATGKSTVSEKLNSEGFAVICADALVKEVYKSEVTISHIKKYYPQVFTKESIDFKKLRELFFSDNNIQKDIEGLIYSQMPSAFIAAYHALKDPDVVIYDVPLLFEKGLHKLVDVKATVYCSQEEQVKRLIKRDSISEELANNIISKQMPIEEKRNSSDIVIDNSKEEADLASFLSLFK